MGKGRTRQGLLHHRVPIDVVSATLRFSPPKTVYYWANERCAAAPCANVTRKRCA